MATRRRRRARTSHRRRRAVAVYAPNPIRRRRRRRRSFAYARNPAPRRRRRSMSMARRRYRRNPSARRRIGGGISKLSHMVLPAAGIGLGAVGSEIAMGYLPLPASMKTGVARHLTKGGVGIIGGLIIGKLLRQPRLGKFFAAGAIAIATHDAVKELITSKMPSIRMAGMGAYLPAGNVRGSLGYYSPAATMRYSEMGEYVPASQVRGALHGGTPDFGV